MLIKIVPFIISVILIILFEKISEENTSTSENHRPENKNSLLKVCVSSFLKYFRNFFIFFLLGLLLQEAAGFSPIDKRHYNKSILLLVVWLTMIGVFFETTWLISRFSSTKTHPQWRIIKKADIVISSTAISIFVFISVFDFFEMLSREVTNKKDDIEFIASLFSSVPMVMTTYCFIKYRMDLFEDVIGVEQKSGIKRIFAFVWHEMIRIALIVSIIMIFVDLFVIG